MMIKAVDAILKTSTDLVTIPNDLYKTHVKTAYIFVVNKK
jgi:hypothetical protein